MRVRERERYSEKERDSDTDVETEGNRDLRCVYISEFRTQFCIKLARFAKKGFFITKRASLVQNRP